MSFLSSASVSVTSKFEEIRKSNQAAAQRLVESHVSSSSDEDDDYDDDDGDIDHKDGKTGKILASTFTTYTDQTGNSSTDLKMTWFLDQLLWSWTIAQFTKLDLHHMLKCRHF